MATSVDMIRQWLKEGKKQGATHTLIATDTFDHDDYPVYVMPGTDVRTKYSEYNGPNMQKVMEVYAHHEDHEKQLAIPRNFNFTYPKEEKKVEKVKEKLSSNEMHDVIHIVKNVKDKEQLQTLIKVAQKQLKEGK